MKIDLVSKEEASHIIQQFIIILSFTLPAVDLGSYESLSFVLDLDLYFDNFR